MHKRFAWGWVALLGLTSAMYATATGAGLFVGSVLISGALCVALTAIGRREGYLVGLYNSAGYALIAWQNGLYGEVWLNLAFYIPTGIVGFLMWSRRLDADAVVAMRALRLPGVAITAAICAAGIAGLGWLLARIPTQNTPYVDAATNVLAVVATVLTMLRYRDQWLVYFALNALSIVMWALRWAAEGVASDAMVVMWTLFLLNSAFGWWRWNRGSRQADGRR